MSPANALSIRSLKESVSPQEWAVRVDLAACYRLVAAYGWSDLVFTHITARVPGADDQFLINPYGMFFDEIHGLQPRQDRRHGQEARRLAVPVNPAGFTIHSAVHAARHDITCVLHTHSLNGVAVSAQKEGLLPISQQSIFVLAALGYHPYEASPSATTRSRASSPTSARTSSSCSAITACSPWAPPSPKRSSPCI